MHVLQHRDTIRDMTSNGPRVSFVSYMTLALIAFLAIGLGGHRAAQPFNTVTPPPVAAAPTTPVESEWWPDPTFPPAAPPQHASPTSTSAAPIPNGGIGAAESITAPAGGVR